VIPRYSPVAQALHWLGDAVPWLAGLHALAALVHHFFLGGFVLASTLPRWISPPQRNKA
jgi:cytochrome b561